MSKVSCLVSAVLLFVLLMFGISCDVYAAEPSQTSGDKVVAIIEKEQVLGPNCKVLAKVAGNEATISTYRHKESKDKDNDCKIDAALIAKELMISNDLGLRRVMVHFHEPDLTGNYREVNVSYAEIKAFASGAVEQKDFLDSLGINLVAEPVKRVNDTSSSDANAQPELGSGISVAAGSAGPNGTATESTGQNPGDANKSAGNSNSAAGTELASAAGVPKPVKITPPKRVPYTTRTGISFLVPQGWQMNDRFASGGVIFKLTNPKSGWNEIEFHLKREMSTPLAAAALMKKKYTYPGSNVERYQRTRFGKGSYEGVFVVAQYDHESERYYEMHLYFGAPGALYDLWGWCPVSHYATVEPAYFEVMSSMAFPESKSSKAAGVAANKSKASGAKKSAGATKQ